MSWRLLLAEYPDPILDGEIPLAILALLDRNGLLTEPELLGQLKIDRHILIEKLLALYKGRFVEYLRHHIKLSDKGRRILNRFALQPDIVEDLINQLPILPTNRKDLRDAVLQYREDAFEQYLASVTAVKSWRRTWSTGSFKEQSKTGAAEIGSLAIIIRDLRDWLIHTPSINSEAAKIWHFLGHGDITNTVDTPHVDESTHVALKWLNALDAVERAPNPWLAMGNTENPSIGLFCAHQTSRDRLNLSLFLDEWSPDGQWFTILSACHSGYEALENVQRYGMNNWDFGPGSRHELSTYYTRGKSLAGNRVTQDLGNFLISLLAAQTFDELKASTGFPDTLLNTLLKQIGEKCEDLLHGDRPVDESLEEDSSNIDKDDENPSA
jgi:hypothetical protein